MIETIQNIVYEIGTFIYETPIKVVIITAAGIACRIFNHQLAFPLLTIACEATLIRIAAKVIEKSNFRLSIEINSKMQDIKSAYGSLYYPILAITMAANMIIPLLGRIMSIGFGVYQGLISEIQILQLKYYTRIDKKENDNSQPTAWMRGY